MKTITKMKKELKIVEEQIEDNINRLSMFEEAFYNKQVLQRNTEQEFKIIKKDIFNEYLTPLLFKHNMMSKKIKELEDE